MAAAIVNHVGLCVSDLGRSRRFYEALGLVFDHELRPPDELTAPLLGLKEPVGLTAAYLRSDAFTLELLHYEPGSTQPPQPRVMNELGLTHLSFTVDDVPGTLDRLQQLGGEVIEESDITLAVMIRDPDGQLLELLASK